jgi:hypothetical protein
VNRPAKQLAAKFDWAAVRIMMEAGATQRAAWSLLLTTKLFGIVDNNSSPLHVLFCVCVSILALVLGAKVIQRSIEDMDMGNPTISIVYIIYKV